MIFHVARINVVSVANAFQQHFTGKHLEQMRVRERRFNRGIHALVQRADHAGIHKMVAPQQFPYLVQTLHGSAHLGNRYVSPIRAAFTSAGQQRVYGTMQYRSQIGKQGNVRQRLPVFPNIRIQNGGLVDFTHKAVVNIDGLFLLAVLACVFLVNDNLLN